MTWADFAQEAKLTASDGAASDFFGSSVAVSGTTAVIGVGDDNSGSAYVFENSGGTWTQVAKLTADDGADFDSFGTSVAVSGTIAVIGAHKDDNDDNNEVDSGSAYVFEKIGDNWSQVAKLTADDGDQNDQFGWSVAISGTTVVIGAHDADNVGADNLNVEDSGSAYVFEKIGDNWTQVDKLTADDGAAFDSFGTSVAVSGTTAVIGASGIFSSSSGSAYVFENSGGTWTQVDKLTADDGDPNDRFGTSVAVLGTTAVIGAEDDDDLGSSSGSAYVFEKIGGTWTQDAKLTANDGAEFDFFGTSVAVSGSTAVIGAYGDDDQAFAAGAAYVFGPAFTLTVDSDGNGSGTVGGGGIFLLDTEVTPAATADPGSIFTGWTPASCGSPFALTADTTCTATFVSKLIFRDGFE